MEQFLSTLQSAYEYVLSSFGEDRRLHAVAIVLASFLVGKIADWIISGLIARWARRTETSLDDRLIAMLHRPIFLGVLLAGLALATDRLELSEGPKHVTFGLLGTMAVFIGFGLLIRLSRLILEALSQNHDRFPLVDLRTLPIFRNLSNLILIGAAVYFFFVVWGIDVTGWLMSAGIVGIALGFAAKDTLANFFAGVFIMADAPYKVGDFIVLDSGERGRVTQIGLRSTRMLTRDDIEITVPNAVMGQTKIINETGGPHEKERIRIPISVAYGCDIDEVKKVLLEIALAHEEICSDPEPRVRFRAFGASGLDLELLGWIDEPVLRGRLIDALNTDVYRRLTKEGIEIPYTKQDLYIKEMPRERS